LDDFSLDAYDFDLPDALVAQRPPERRDGARMLVLDRATGAVADRRFTDLAEYVRPHDAVVLNDTRVVPARLVGTRRPGGGGAEVFLVQRHADGAWTALVRPGRKLGVGAVVDLPDGGTAVIEEVEPDGKRRVRLGVGTAPFADETAEAVWLDAVGQMPLPPYVARPEPDPADRARYQTVVAVARGAVAAPTAGLHFTPETLDALRARGAAVATVTLHVGYGTFEPVRVDDLRTHRVAAERATVPPATADVLTAARAAGGRTLAVGTTTTRTLEWAADADGTVRACTGDADLTVTPGYRFRAVDALLTNFHLPRSSLLVLVGAFAGRERVMAAYRHAVAAGYRFYSYGDCMLIV
jgi:S-adenosylmethionine:tRNA ribosyltransferase-isomerase